MKKMVEKLTSRKFLISAAAFLASLGTGIVGLANGNEAVAIAGGICTVLSGAIYAACEAYVDGQSCKASATLTNVNVSANSTDKALVKEVISGKDPESADK